MTFYAHCGSFHPSRAKISPFIHVLVSRTDLSMEGWGTIESPVWEFLKSENKIQFLCDNTQKRISENSLKHIEIQIIQSGITKSFPLHTYNAVAVCLCFMFVRTLLPPLAFWSNMPDISQTREKWNWKWNFKFAASGAGSDSSGWVPPVSVKYLLIGKTAPSRCVELCGCEEESQP